MAVAKELLAVPSMEALDETLPFAAEKQVLKNLKKAVLMVAGAAAQKFMAKFQEEQEILINLADMLNEVFVAESAILRVEKLASLRGEAAVAIHKDMALVNLQNAVDIVNRAGKEAITSFAEGDELRVMLMGLKRFTKAEPFNMKAARQRIAEFLIEKNEYAF